MCLFQLQIACLKTFDLGRYWRCLEPQVRGMLSIRKEKELHSSMHCVRSCQKLAVPQQSASPNTDF